jgi:hypothetical protein
MQTRRMHWAYCINHCTLCYGFLELSRGLQSGRYPDQSVRYRTYRATR